MTPTLIALYLALQVPVALCVGKAIARGFEVSGYTHGETDNATS